MRGPAECGDPGCQSLTNAKVGRLPGDFLSEIDEAFGYACNRDLSSLLRRLHVQFDVAGEIEAALNGSID